MPSRQYLTLAASTCVGVMNVLSLSISLSNNSNKTAIGKTNKRTEEESVLFFSCRHKSFVFSAAKEYIIMGKFFTVMTHLHTLAGPSLMLLYPLYASVVAIESTSKLDDEQWLAYWILYSFLTLMEMLLQPMLQWIPIWYDLKLAMVAWLVLPQFRGAAFIYEKFVREKLITKYGARYFRDKSSPHVTPPKVSVKPSEDRTD